jgi:hypothetical protein
MQFAAPTGSLPRRGQYEAAVRRGEQGGSPGLEVTGNGHGCNRIFGRFLVSELTFDANHNIQSFAADFEQICDPEITLGELFGSIRYNSGVSITPRVSVGIRSPARKGNAGRSDGTAVVSLSMPSDKVVTAHFDTVDGTAVQGTDYVATSGRVTFQPGQTGLAVTVPIIGDREARGDKRFGIRLRQSNALLGARFAWMKIRDPNIPLTVIAAQSEHSGQHRDGLGSGYSYVVTPDDDIFSTSRSSSDNSVTVSASGPFTWFPPASWRVVFAAPNKGVLIPGIYDNAQRWPVQRAGRPGLSVTIDWREATRLAGQFVINQVEYGKNGEVRRLSADFQQYSDGAKLGLFGWIRIRAPLQQASITNAEINGSTAVFTVTLNPASTKQEVLTFSTRDGGALAGVDYRRISTTVTFEPGETIKTVPVQILKGATAEKQFFGIVESTTTAVWNGVGSAILQ